MILDGGGGVVLVVGVCVRGRKVFVSSKVICGVICLIFKVVFLC